MQKDYFKDVYTDFFGIESLPKIEVKEKKEEVGPQEKMALLFPKIDNLYLRTLLRSFCNPGLYIYMIRHYIQGFKGSHNPRPKNP